MSDWVKKWEQEKIPNCEKFGLSAQTSNALKRTLLCYAASIEDLLKTDGYKFIMTVTVTVTQIKGDLDSIGK